MKKNILFMITLLCIMTGFMIPISADGETPTFELAEDETIVNFSPGVNHFSILTSKGDFWMMGTNYDGQLGTGVSDWGSVVPIYKNNSFNLAEGDAIVDTDNGIVQSSMITAFGRVFVWGRNTNYNLGDGTTTNRLSPVEITSSFNLDPTDRIIQIAFGYEHTIALSLNGKVFAWGRNNDYQLAHIAPNNYRSTPYDISSQFTLNVGETIVSIAAGGYHSAAFTSENRLLMWGANREGQIGNDPSQSDPYNRVPTDVMSIYGLAEGEIISCYSLGFNHTSITTSLGRVFFHGTSDDGVIGNNVWTDQLTPLDLTYAFDLEEGETIVKSMAILKSSMVYTSNGRVFVWGDNYYGQVGDGYTTDRRVPFDITSRFPFNEGEEISFITIGGHNGFVITNQKRMIGWGNNSAQLGGYLPTYTLIPSVIRVTSPKVLYQIAFDVDGGSSVDVIEAEVDTPITAPTPPTKLGFTFGGWYKDEELTQSYTFNLMPEENITLYAKWSIVNYTITYHLNNSTNHASNPTTYNVETPTITLENPTRTGHTFGGWYDNDTFTGSPVTQIEVGSTGNKIIYAKWTINQYTISFEENGGTDVGDITQNFGTSVQTPQQPTKLGYTFVAWYSNSELTSYYSFTTMPASNITLYARWNINQYTISFEENGGTNVTNITQNFDTNISEPLPPTKVGFTFSGWYADSGLTQSYAFSKMQAANITLYAKWTVNQYTISFEENGGSSVIDITQDYESNVQTPSQPTKLGYAFEGWYSNIQLTSHYLITTMPADNITLYAKWTRETYTITYQLNGGTNATQNPSTYHIESPDIVFSNPTKVGHTFVGWYNNEDFSGEAITQIDSGSTNAKTMYAKWDVNQYQVSFDTKGGSSISTLTINYGSQLSLPANPTKEGYTFNGWNQTLPSTMPAQNLTLSAFWLKVEEIKDGVEASVDGLFDAVDPTLIQDKDVDLTLRITIKNESDVEDTEKSSIYTLIDESTEIKKQGVIFFDISLLLKESGLDDVALNTLSNHITITLSIPEEHRGYKNYGIVRVHQGTAELLDVNYDEVNHTLSFETDRFSTYSIVYEMSSGSGLWWLLLLLIIPAGYFGYRYKEEIQEFLDKMNQKIMKKETSNVQVD